MPRLRKEEPALGQQADVREAVAQERLVQVLPEWGVPRLPIQAVMSSRLQPASVKALVDFLASRLALA